jgi:anti-sigma B factor antagonist
MNPEITVLSPQGRLDAAGAPPLEAALKEQIDAGKLHLVVTLENTQYISSNGLRALLAAQRLAQTHGGALKLCCLSPRLTEIFEMSGFDKVFEIFETREQAEKSLG